MSAKDYLCCTQSNAWQNKGQTLLTITGEIASCLELIPNARLFMGPIQLHFENWNPSTISLDIQSPCTQN